MATQLVLVWSIINYCTVIGINLYYMRLVKRENYQVIRPMWLVSKGINIVAIAFVVVLLGLVLVGVKVDGFIQLLSHLMVSASWVSLALASLSRLILDVSDKNIVKHSAPTLDELRRLIELQETHT